MSTELSTKRGTSIDPWRAIDFALNQIMPPIDQLGFLSLCQTARDLEEVAEHYPNFLPFCKKRTSM